MSGAISSAGGPCIEPWRHRADMTNIEQHATKMTIAPSCDANEAFFPAFRRLHKADLQCAGARRNGWKSLAPTNV